MASRTGIEPCRRRENKAIRGFQEIFKKMSWQLSTTKVLPDKFGELIAGHSIAVFHFYASWNRYDVTMDQMLGDIADAYKDHIFIGSIDTDDQENWERCKELRILNLPAIAVFVNSQHYETVIGLLSKKSLNNKVEEWLNTART